MRGNRWLMRLDWMKAASVIMLSWWGGVDCLLLLVAAPASAQQWPTKPVKIIVSFGPGAAADILARILADRLAPVLGQPVVVENRAGAGGHVGAASVARSEPDGYTLLMSGSPTHSVGPYLFKQLNYDPMRDVPPVAMIASAPNLLVANAALPVSSLTELVELMRSKPGTITYTSAGIGTSGHLAAELLKSSAKLDTRHVPYKSGTDAMMGVIAGDIGFMFFTVPSVLPQVEAGKLRALAVTSLSRTPQAPNVPTVAESGYPGFEALAWYALFAPRETPQPIVDRLANEVEIIVAKLEVASKMLELGAEPSFKRRDDLVRFVAVEAPRWGELLRAAGIKHE